MPRQLALWSVRSIHEADRIQREIIRKMSPAKKFTIAGEIYKIT